MKFTKDIYKISGKVGIPEKNIEAIILYDSLPVKKFIASAKEKEKFFDSVGSKYRSLILTTDGNVYTCQYTAKTMAGRTENIDFIRTDSWCFLNRNYIVQEFSSDLNRMYSKYMKEKKLNGKYINLAQKKAVQCFIEMKSGYVYGCSLLKETKTK